MKQWHFNTFKHKKCENTFAYWNQFVEMVSLLRDLIRADREGNRSLHLHSLKSILPSFAQFDRTNYMRWCSVYVEDMQQLSEK